MTSTKEEPRTANTESEAERRHREGAAAVAAQEHGWFEHQSEPVIRREGSGEPKTLTLTLEEALLTMALEQGETLAYLHTPPNADPIDEPSGWVIAQADGWYRGHYSTWPEAASRALGVPVVARDEANDDLTTAYLAGLEKGRDAARAEAAELRAENAQLRADLREYVEDGFLQGAHRQEDGGYSTGGISTYRDLGDWLVEHAGWTRREGGVGRMQVYDPPRRLVGGESER